jgi:phosphatidylglycerophosphate synthase
MAHIDHAAQDVSAGKAGRDASVIGDVKALATTPNRIRPIPAGPLTGLVAQALLLAALARMAGQGPAGLNRAGWAVGVACGVITNSVLAAGISRYRTVRLSAADWVTLARATLAVGVAALVADSFQQPVSVTVLVSLSTLALVLDAVDGWIARRTRTTGPLGAQFDGEADAFLILVLSVYVARSTGVWVLAIGAARYAFLVAQWPLRWMRATLPARPWRKVVTATQGIVLTTAMAGLLSPPLTTVALLVALALLAESFGRDVWWLWRRRGGTWLAGAGSELSSHGPGGGPANSRARSGLAALCTLLALVVVWAALVAPDQPSGLNPAGFLRVPLEGLVLVALALVMPSRARRVLAAAAGLVLAVVVLLKALDIGFFTTFDRPFDPLGDSGYAGIGIETLRSAIGRTEANLVVAGIVVLAVALLVLTTLAVLRLTHVAAANRRRSLRVIGALGVVWGVCWLSGAALEAHMPIASTSAAGLVLGEVRTVRADIRDQGVFAQQIRHDQFRYTPGNRLLTALRGKDVLLVFVESYGRVTVQGSSFAPAVDALLSRSTRRLQAAGFSAQSAFVTSSTFGGVSWLAHATLQAGVSANSQRRYDQLVATDRLTLSDAFRRAGWRTVDDAPADDRTWPAGTSFYHYDRLYDRRDVGYRGPTFTYAPMPDQYLFSALQRLELAKAHRRPIFAEVDTVSSHMPWNRIPQMVPWQDVGDGSVFSHTPMDHETGAFWSNPTRVKAAYARSIEYSLNALTSFVTHYGKKNLVLVVVGDEQPLPIVSGQGASHDVPISVIAHDPAVLNRISGWGWDGGMLPRPQAPVWPMSAFRDRFLTAFGSQPAIR